MTHRFPIKEIARQAGLGVATVDRVLHNRQNVSPQTRRRVEAAMDELASQEQQLSARGRRLFIDIVAEAPRRFSGEVRRATEAILPVITSGVFRPRFIFQETATERDMDALLQRIAKRGSHGVCLKARDIPSVRHAVDRLEAAGIPVVTLVTDLPASSRTGYVGLDNANAGRTAAYLLARSVGSGTATVLATRSQDAFSGEAERYNHFIEALGVECPGAPVIDISGGAGMGGATAARLGSALDRVSGGPVAVYSMGGGNAAILRVLQDRKIDLCAYVAHDLDRENLSLLRDGRVDFVLYHDLQNDMRNVMSMFAACHGLGPKPASVLTSDIQIVTPFNVPGGSAA